MDFRVEPAQRVLRDSRWQTPVNNTHQRARGIWRFYQQVVNRKPPYGYIENISKDLLQKKIQKYIKYTYKIKKKFNSCSNNGLQQTLFTRFPECTSGQPSLSLCDFISTIRDAKAPIHLLSFRSLAVSVPPRPSDLKIKY